MSKCICQVIVGNDSHKLCNNDNTKPAGMLNVENRSDREF